MEKFVETERAVMESYLGGTPIDAPLFDAPVSARFPMLTDAVSSSDGRALTARLDISLKSAPYLADHAFGRATSAALPGRHGLCIVPLTFSIEALAQAAAALCPDLVVVGLREVRASRWIALNRSLVRLDVEAELRESGAVRVVRVRMRDADGPALRPVIVEADVELAAARPAPPLASRFFHRQPRSVDWSRADIYSRIMFHGPRLQALENMRLAAADGAEGQIVGLAHDDLYTATPSPVFETDAITLDAVGQLVGVWAAETLPEAFHIFPFRVERIEIFRDRLATGERADCRCRIALPSDDDMRSDIEVVTQEGRLQCRIEGWWDKRFDLPKRFFNARLDPAARPVSRLTQAGPDGLEIQIAFTDDISDALLNGSGGIWANVLAGLVLNPEETESWLALATAPPRRRFDWLRGRVAAKDAARAVLGGAFFPADIAILPSEGGNAPHIALLGAKDARAVPIVSIAHSGGVACAAVADPQHYASLGIDIETISPRSDAFLVTAFSPEERAFLPTDTPGRDRIATWMWAAKEAVAKSFETGLEDALSRFKVCALHETRRTVTVRNVITGATCDVAIDETAVDGHVVALATQAHERNPVTGRGE